MNKQTKKQNKVKQTKLEQASTQYGILAYLVEIIYLLSRMFSSLDRIRTGPGKPGKSWNFVF